jgi:hypothetical protein
MYNLAVLFLFSLMLQHNWWSQHESYDSAQLHFYSVPQLWLRNTYYDNNKKCRVLQWDGHKIQHRDSTIYSFSTSSRDVCEVRELTFRLWCSILARNVGPYLKEEHQLQVPEN